MIAWDTETIFIHPVNPCGSATLISLSDIPLATYTSRNIYLSHKQPSDTDISLAYRAHVKDSAKELYDTRAKTTAAQMSDSTLCDPK